MNCCKFNRSVWDKLWSSYKKSLKLINKLRQESRLHRLYHLKKNWARCVSFTANSWRRSSICSLLPLKKKKKFPISFFTAAPRCTHGLSNASMSKMLSIRLRAAFKWLWGRGKALLSAQLGPIAVLMQANSLWSSQIAHFLAPWLKHSRTHSILASVKKFFLLTIHVKR